MGAAARARAWGWMVLAVALLVAGFAGALTWRAGGRGDPAADAGALAVTLPAAVEAGPVTWRVERAQAAVTGDGRGLLTLALRPELAATAAPRATPILHEFRLLENNRAAPGGPERNCLVSAAEPGASGALSGDLPACTLEFPFALDAALTLAVEDPYSEARGAARVAVGAR